MSTASPISLPISREISKPSSSRCSINRSTSRNRTAFRCAGATSDQTPLSKAPRATETARFTSPASQEATLASSLPVAGFVTSYVAPAAASTNLPPINAWVGNAISAAFAFHSSRVRVGIYSPLGLPDGRSQFAAAECTTAHCSPPPPRSFPSRSSDVIKPASLLLQLPEVYHYL